MFLVGMKAVYYWNCDILKNSGIIETISNCQGHTMFRHVNTIIYSMTYIVVSNFIFLLSGQKVFLIAWYRD